MHGATLVVSLSGCGDLTYFHRCIWSIRGDYVVMLLVFVYMSVVFCECGEPGWVMEGLGCRSSSNFGCQ